MYGYTPPQEEQYLDPFVDESTATTFLFTPRGTARKEKRENWIWKSQPSSKVRQPSDPFSYEYVMRDGQLAHIAEVHPATDDGRKAERRSHDDGASDHHRHQMPYNHLFDRPQRANTVTKRVRFGERHSSPAAPSASFFPAPAKDSAVKRSLSLSKLKARCTSPEPAIRKDMIKLLPPLPKPTTETHSRVSLDRSVSNFDLDFAQWTSPRDVAAPAELASRLSHRQPYSSSMSSSNTASRHSPASSLQISPRRSFEEPRPAPSPPVRKNAPRAMGLPTPPSTPPSMATTHPTPTLRRRPSKFVEHLDEGSPHHVPRVDVTTAVPAPPVKVALPSSLTAAPLLPTPRSSLQRRDSADMFVYTSCPLYLSSPGQPQEELKQQQQQQWPLTASAMSFLDTSAGSPPPPRSNSTASSNGMLVPSLVFDSDGYDSDDVGTDDEKKYMMSGALLPAKKLPAVLPPRRSVSLRVTADEQQRKHVQMHQAVPIVTGRLCTAEVLAVGMRSPIIASGNARLVSC